MCRVLSIRWPTPSFSCVFFCVDIDTCLKSALLDRDEHIEWIPMQLTSPSLLLIPILFCIPSHLLHQKREWGSLDNANQTFVSNEIFIHGERLAEFPNRSDSRECLTLSLRWYLDDDDDAGVDDLPSRKFIPSVITEYPLPINVRTKYFSDEESYVLRESIIFAFRTNQEISEAITLLAGLVTDSIYYAFDIEVCSFSSCYPIEISLVFKDGRVKIFFTEESLPDLFLTSNKTHFIFVNNGQWHRLRIERVHRKVLAEHRVLPVRTCPHFFLVTVLPRWTRTISCGSTGQLACEQELIHRCRTDSRASRWFCGSHWWCKSATRFGTSTAEQTRIFVL